MKNNLKPSVLLLLCLIGFPQISETIYSPALPIIARHLATSNAMVQWTLSIYFFGFAFGVLCWGSVSDHIGRKPTMLCGLLIYTLGSLGCMLANNITMLMSMRLLQAFGASVGSVITMTMIRECFDGQKRHHLFAVIGMALSSTSALGPLIGGYLSHMFGWRSNFIALSIMGLLIFIYSSIALPETYSKTTIAKTAMFTIIKRMLGDKHVIACSWVIAAINGVIFCFWQEAPFIFTHNMAVSTANYGYVGITIGLASYLGSLTYKRLLLKFNAFRLYKMGALGALVSAILMLIPCYAGWINASHPMLSALLLMFPMMLLVYALIGFVLPYVLSHAMDNYKDYLGRASALFGFSYYIGLSSLTWLMGYLHNGTTWMMPLYFLALVITIGIASQHIEH